MAMRMPSAESEMAGRGDAEHGNMLMQASQGRERGRESADDSRSGAGRAWPFPRREGPHRRHRLPHHTPRRRSLPRHHHQARTRHPPPLPPQPGCQLRLQGVAAAPKPGQTYRLLSLLGALGCLSVSICLHGASAHPSTPAIPRSPLMEVQGHKRSKHDSRSSFSLADMIVFVCVSGRCGGCDCWSREARDRPQSCICLHVRPSLVDIIGNHTRPP